MIKHSLDKDVLFLLKEIDSDVIKNTILLEFGHGLSHIISGLVVIDDLPDIFDQEIRRSLKIAWVLHDLGRDFRDPFDQSNHAVKSSIIASKYLNGLGLHKDQVEAILEGIKNHSTENFVLNDQLTSLLFLVDTITIYNSIGSDTISYLDRIIVSKVGEIYLDIISDRNVKIEGYGKKDSSATKLLETKLELTVKHINTIRKEYPHLEVIAMRALNSIENVKKYYFIKRNRLLILLTKVLINPLFFINLIPIYLKFLSFIPFLFATVIRDDFEMNQKIIDTLGLKGDYLAHHRRLMNNGFYNEIFKSILTNTI